MVVHACCRNWTGAWEGDVARGLAETGCPASVCCAGSCRTHRHIRQIISFISCTSYVGSWMDPRCDGTDNVTAPKWGHQATGSRFRSLLQTCFKKHYAGVKWHFHFRKLFFCEEKMAFYAIWYKERAMLSAEEVNSLWKEQNENERERTINKRNANKERYIRHSFSAGLFELTYMSCSSHTGYTTHSFRNASSSSGFKQAGTLVSGDEVKYGWSYTSSVPTWLHGVNSDTYTVNFHTKSTPNV